jgi:hypothetical protein
MKSLIEGFKFCKLVELSDLPDFDKNAIKKVQFTGKGKHKQKAIVCLFLIIKAVNLNN